VLPGEEQPFRILVRSCFQWRRKQMGTILRDHPDLTLERDGMELLRGLGIDPRQRPETVAPERFLALTRALAEGV